MKIIEMLTGIDGKQYEILKDYGTFSDSNLFCARLTGGTRGTWFKTQKDMHAVIRKGWIKDARGNAVRPEVNASR